MKIKETLFAVLLAISGTVLAEPVKVDTAKAAVDDRNKAARASTGLNPDVLDAAIDHLRLLQQERKELEEAGQTIKAQRKQREAEQAENEIKNIFRVGRSILATPECPIERTSDRLGIYGGVDYGYKEGREFRFSCLDRRPQQDIIFIFVAPADGASHWPAGVKTSNDLTEKFEGGSRFTGSVQIVEGRRSDRLPGEAVRIFGDVFNHIVSHIVVEVKINSLQPLADLKTASEETERQAPMRFEESRKEATEAEKRKEEEKEKQEVPAVFANWMKDSATIMAMIADARQHRASNDDSEVQKKAKKKAHEASLVSANKKLQGTPFSISAARLDEVTPEKVLNQYGKQKAREIISRTGLNQQDMESNPGIQLMIGFSLASCGQCYTETGRSKATYSIPVPNKDGSYATYGTGPYAIPRGGIVTGEPPSQYSPDQPVTLGTKIRKTIGSESEALAMRKGAIAPLSGTIRGLYYDGYSVEIEIQ